MSSFGSRLAACCADCDNPNPEVRAYYFAGFGRSGLFMTFNFLVSAVIHFAYLDAGCVRYGDEAFGDDGNFDDGEKSSFYEKGWEGSSNGSGSKPVECMGTVLGLKPSSIVSVLATVGGLVAMFGMPLAGSIIDATDKRQEFGAASAAVLVVSNAVQVFITQDTWLVMVIIQAIVCTFSFFSVSLVVYAYLPELFDNQADNVRVTAQGRLYEQGGMLGLIVLTTIVGLSLGLGVVNTAMFSQALAVIVGGPALYFAFQLYKPRKANRQVPPGRWLVVDGFLHQAAMFQKLRSEYPVVARYLVGQMFVEAATGTLTTAAVLILDKAGMSAWVGPYLAVILVCMMFGPPLQKVVATATSVKVSLLWSVAAFNVVTILFIFLGNSPPAVWCFAPVVGIIYGWYYPGLNGLMATLCPGGLEGEIAGLNIFTSICLSWLPPLVITALNEANLLNVGLLVIPLFWCIGASVWWTLDMELSEVQIKGTLHKRQRWMEGDESKEDVAGAGDGKFANFEMNQTPTAVVYPFNA